MRSPYRIGPLLERLRRVWEAWLGLDEDDEASWEPPAFAERLDRHPSSVEFEKPAPTKRAKKR